MPRDARHTTHLAFETADGNAMTFGPWGPVALWASTDTVHADVESAKQIAPDDIRSLLSELNSHLASRSQWTTSFPCAAEYVHWQCRATNP